MLSLNGVSSVKRLRRRQPRQFLRERRDGHDVDHQRGRDRWSGDPAGRHAAGGRLGGHNRDSGPVTAHESMVTSVQRTSSRKATSRVRRSDDTDARNDVLGCFGRSSRRAFALRQVPLPSYEMGRLVCLPEHDLDRHAVTVSFRQGGVHHPAGWATVAVLVLAHRNGCKRAPAVADRLAAGAEPVSGIVAASRTRRKSFRYRSSTLEPQPSLGKSDHSRSEVNHERDL